MTENTPEAIRLKSDVKGRVETLDGLAADTNARNSVISALAHQEMERRTELLSKSLQKRDALFSDLQKIKSKVTGYTEEGDEIRSFSKADFDARKKATEKLAKLDKAIDAVITGPSTASYGKLKERLNKS